jgi:hypothetical protein
MKRRNPNQLSNPDFLESVDEPLRELVEFCQELGIRTTPSCAGHYKSKQDFEKIYESLEKDQDDIKNRGLSFTDIETGRTYSFRDENYSVPWDKETFVNRMSEYQKNGIIGIKPGRKQKLREEILSLQIPGVDILDRDGVILFFVKGEGNPDHASVWKKITSEVKRIFTKFFHLKKKENVNERLPD